MNNQDFDTFSEMWAAAYEAVSRGKTPSAGATNIAFEALKDHDLRQISQALTRHVRDAEAGRYGLVPGDIVRQIEGTPTEQAQSAWAKVEHALRRVGGGPSWVFDDPKIHRAIQQIGGIAALSNCPSEKDLTFLREQFCKRYASPHNSGAYPAKLTGWHTDAETVFIGNDEACQRVLDGGGDSRPAISNASDAAEHLLEDMRAGGEV